MKTRIALRLLLVATLAGCGGAGPGATGKTGATTKPGATAGQAATGKPAGPVDCAAILAAAESLVGLQFLAQLTTPENVASIKSQVIGNLDLDKMLAALGTMHALDGYTSVLGDPKAALDFYEKAARAAKVLFAMDPVTQAAIDTFNSENVGTVADFLGHQVAISGAIGEADC
jgi:hypothetical protein